MSVTITSYSIDDLPDTLFAGIGKIVARWGYLEFQLGVIAREIAHMPKETGRVLTIGPGVTALCRMLRIFASSDHWIKDAVLRADLKSLAKEVMAAHEHRNEYAHGVFGFEIVAGQKKFVRHLLRGPQHSISPGIEVLTDAGLHAISEEARILWDSAQDITTRLKELKKKNKTGA